MKRPVRIAARAIILHENRLLLVNAYKGRGDLWCAPGGGAEPHQSLPQNLAREVHEETGLSVRVDAPCLLNEFHDPNGTFHQVEIGETINTGPRIVTLEDIEHFAEFTGDTFYAHMDDAAAKRNPFFPGRVAHGYLLLSFAAGMFVEPNEGPVLANTGLDNLRFMKPVQAGDCIQVRLTVKKKTPRNEEYGEVRWHVTLSNQDAEKVAEYELLTMNAYAR